MKNVKSALNPEIVKAMSGTAHFIKKQDQQARAQIDVIKTKLMCTNSNAFISLVGIDLLDIIEAIECLERRAERNEKI